MDIDYIGKDLAKRVETQKDLNDITDQLVKVVFEHTLNSVYPIVFLDCINEVRNKNTSMPTRNNTVHRV